MKKNYVFRYGIGVIAIFAILQYMELLNLEKENIALSESMILFHLAFGITAVVVVVGFFAELKDRSSKKVIKTVIDEETIDEDINVTQSETKEGISTAVDSEIKATVSTASEIEQLCNKTLSLICNKYSLAQGIFSVRKKETDDFFIKGTYAYYNENTDYTFKVGEGISGQVAKNKKTILLSQIPEGYINVVSGLGESSPNFLLVLPILHSGETIAVIELASFTEFKKEIYDLEKGVFKQLSQKVSELM